MKKTSEPLVFFGNERLATGVSTTAPILRALIANGYDIKAVVAKAETNKSRSIRISEVANIAALHNIPVLSPKKLMDIKEQLFNYGARVGILAAYGKIIPEDIINLFPVGIINIHPSLLPLHRGPTPIESVILGGDVKTGVSIMKLAKEMDAGPIYGQSELPLIGTESKQALVDNLLEIGKSMLIELLPGILDGSLVALPQDHSRATYDNLISKNDGIIDWQKPADQIEREIRAFIEWPKSHTELTERGVIITKAYSLPDNRPGRKPGDIEVIKEPGILMIECGQGSLCIERLKPTGKPEMSSRAFLAGYNRI